MLDDDHLMFADLASPRTVEDLRRNAAIEVNVVGAVPRTGHRSKGRDAVIGEGERFEQLVARYSSGNRAIARPTERIRHVVVVEVYRCLPLISPAYDLGATEAEISERWETYFSRLWAERRASSRPLSS